LETSLNTLTYFTFGTMALTLNWVQITGILLTILSTILVLVCVGIAGAGAGSEYDPHCYTKSDLEIAVAMGALGMIGHIVASVLYLRSATTVTTQSPIIVGTVATSSPATAINTRPVPAAPVATSKPDGSKFCDGCGTALSGAAFCPGCGKKQ
jgi:NhaP-type Na+/H+ or K+/H+ antiporter